MKFSILIPAYKKRFLREAISSCLQQTYPNLEVIVLDDCSPDDLPAVLADFNDPRLRFYRNETNVGAVDVVDNWNKCLSLCTGDYVICMGDDDMLPPESLTEYLLLIGKYPTLDAYHGRAAIIDEQGAYTDIIPSRSELENVFELMRHRLEGWSQFIGDFCYRTEALRAAGGYYRLPLAWGSDDLTAYTMTADKGIANTSRVAFLYRNNSWSISSASHTDLKLSTYKDTFAWISRYLNSCSCATLEEQLTRDTIIKNLSAYKRDFQAAILCQCFKHSRLKCVGYILRRRKFEASITTVLKALLSSWLA